LHDEAQPFGPPASGRSDASFYARVGVTALIPSAAEARRTNIWLVIGIFFLLLSIDCRGEEAQESGPKANRKYRAEPPR
jgi:hypothetical protein